LSIVLSVQLKAQSNFVPNGSFEKYNNCPNDFEELDPNCLMWFTPMAKMVVIPPPPYSSNNWGSSDYYNNCNKLKLSVPNNYFGYQIAKSGIAYSGILFLYSPSVLYKDFKEYIEIKLNKKLINSQKYCIEFYYSISGYFDETEYYPIEIGALLTDTLVYRLPGINTQQPQNIYAAPQVKQQLPLIRDTINWIKVNGSFNAKGGEQYLTIGNFQNTDTLKNKNIYLYIDDVKLWYCGRDTTPKPADSMIIPNVFTPNGDGFNDRFVFKNQEQWKFETKIFNRWGNLVFDNNNSENWDGTYRGEKVSAGVYFYFIKAVAIKTGNVKVYRGVVTVLY
jgi:gliding motility-associated-like protein